jgi:hypothetical protein
VQVLEQLDLECWDAATSVPVAAALEDGRVVIAPKLHFDLTESEHRFLTPTCLDGKSKNVSYRPGNEALGGTSCTGKDSDDLHAMLRRFHRKSTALLTAICPQYNRELTAGFTSFRPAQIAGRSSSWRKDDTRLHVDAFPSRPLQGLRILRVFSNVNPSEPRQWRVGEPFENIARTFLPRIKPALAGSAWFLQLAHITKTRRTPYDHLMLGIHDGMKADERYQSDSPQTPLAIPPGATWACFTDSVSHAAMSGQFCFEQTFYLPVDAMQDAAKSPLKVLERLTSKVLV